MSGQSGKLPQLWGGFECTVNRVENRFLDQTVISGNEERLADLDLLLDPGLKAVRFPVLLERTLNHETNRLDWRFADERLGCLQELGIDPNSRTGTSWQRAGQSTKLVWKSL